MKLEKHLYFIRDQGGPEPPPRPALCVSVGEERTLRVVFRELHGG